MVDPVRIGGFFSTFDTEAVIQQLTVARQSGIRKLDIQQTKANGQRNAVSGIYGYCLHALTDATLGNVARLDEAERLIFQIGLSWRTATVNLQPNTPTSRLQGAAV